MEKLVIGIEGMSCGGCVLSVEKAIERVPGVQRVEVSLERKEAIVQGASLDRARIAQAVEEAGYDLRP